MVETKGARFLYEFYILEYIYHEDSNAFMLFLTCLLK